MMRNFKRFITHIFSKTRSSHKQKELKKAIHKTILNYQITIRKNKRKNYVVSAHNLLAPTPSTSNPSPKCEVA